MGQCVGRNQRTGERCRRSASGDRDTCHYHAPTTAGPATSKGAVAPAGTPAFTTKELSPRTWADFEALFAEGTGWGRCACLFALDAPRKTRGGTWAYQREVNLATMRGLVDERRSHGILVYDRGAPVGWCQYVATDHLRPNRVADASAQWFITCFVIDRRYRGLGATGVALRAALAAIGRKGGGVVEGHATAMVPGPPPKAARPGSYIEDDVLFHGGAAKVHFAHDVAGIGKVTALYRSDRSMHGAPLGGTMDLYLREGFEVVGVVPRRPSGQVADRIVMRRAL